MVVGESASFWSATVRAMTSRLDEIRALDPEAQLAALVSYVDGLEQHLAEARRVRNDAMRALHGRPEWTAAKIAELARVSVGTVKAVVRFPGTS